MSNITTKGQSVNEMENASHVPDWWVQEPRKIFLGLSHQQVDETSAKVFIFNSWLH